MEEKKELSKVILDTCDKELDGSIGFMLTEREADTFATAILSAGYIKKDEIECDRKKIEGIIIDTLPRLSPNTIGILAENIATHLKSIIK